MTSQSLLLGRGRLHYTQLYSSVVFCYVCFSCFVCLFFSFVTSVIIFVILIMIMWALNTDMVYNFGIFDQSMAICGKRYKIGPVNLEG